MNLLLVIGQTQCLQAVRRIRERKGGGEDFLSQILYETEEKANIFGDGCRYHILECNIKNVSTDRSFKPYAEISSENASEITGILDSLGVPNEKRPKSIDLYYNAVSGKGTASDKLYLLADSDNHILYVIESFY